MIIAIDTGGTKTLVCSFTDKGKKELVVKFPTPADPKEYVRSLKAHIRAKFKPEDVDAIALALPGIVKGNVAVWCPNLAWENFDVTKELGDLLPGVPILVENDANLGGLSESRSLNPVPASSLYVTISTGIGSGFCMNGQIDPGLRLSEIGHIPIEYRKKIDKWENIASGRAIVNTYRKMARDIRKPRTWDAIADRISRGFLVAIPLVQPEAIIIGGSIGTHFGRYSHQLRRLLAARLPRHVPLPKIVQAAHPEEAVIYGCYYYARDFLANR